MYNTAPDILLNKTKQQVQSLASHSHNQSNVGILDLLYNVIHSNRCNKSPCTQVYYENVYRGKWHPRAVVITFLDKGGFGCGPCIIQGPHIIFSEYKTSERCCKPADKQYDTVRDYLLATRDGQRLQSCYSSCWGVGAYFRRHKAQFTKLTAQ